MLPRSLGIQTALSNGLQSLLQPPQKQLHSVCRYFTVHICSVDMPTGPHRRDLMRNQARTISPCFSYHLRDLLFQPDSNRTQVSVPYFSIAGMFLSTCRRFSSNHYIPKRTKAGLHPVTQLGLLFRASISEQAVWRKLPLRQSADISFANWPKPFLSTLMQVTTTSLHLVKLL